MSFTAKRETKLALRSTVYFILLGVSAFFIILTTKQSNRSFHFYYHILSREARDVAPSLLHSVPNLSNDITLVNCTSIEDIQPVNIVRMEHIETKQQYKVSLSWWDSRISKNGNRSDVLVPSNPTMGKLQDLLIQYPGAFVDVGANVGFITNYGTVLNRTVYAIDPISYNIAKICEGYRENVRVGWAIPGSLRLYHAAAGPLFQPLINISRPSDDVGFFDQASLSQEAVFHNKIVKEMIPMLPVDDLVSEKIGVLKIDVQGHEYGVLKGMHKTLLGENYPSAILYEEDEKLAVAAGYSPGQCLALLSNHYGYNCTKIEENVFCVKEK